MEAQANRDKYKLGVAMHFEIPNENGGKVWGEKILIRNHFSNSIVRLFFPSRKASLNPIYASNKRASIRNFDGRTDETEAIL